MYLSVDVAGSKLLNSILNHSVLILPIMDISFEFFPPNTSQAETMLWDSIKLLEPLKPNFVSVTYGAGGTTRNRTHNCVKKIIEETNLEPAAHLTCVNSSKDEKPR